MALAPQSSPHARNARPTSPGTPGVILHGLGGRPESWVPQYDALSGSYRVIGWDAPGYNESSEMPQDEPLIPDYVSVIKCFSYFLNICPWICAEHIITGIATNELSEQCPFNPFWIIVFHFTPFHRLSDFSFAVTLYTKVETLILFIINAIMLQYDFFYAVIDAYIFR